MMHGLITAIYCVLYAIFGIYWLGLTPYGLLAPMFWYMGREFAQAEYRWIDEYGDGKRANMPWWAPFTPAAWTVKGVLDWVIPSCVACFCYFIARCCGA